jgi:hypothetical protein
MNFIQCYLFKKRKRKKKKKKKEEDKLISFAKYVNPKTFEITTC